MRTNFFLAALMLTASIIIPSAEAKVFHNPLPREIAENKNLCAHVPCNEVLPTATSFSERMGSPFYMEGYSGEGPGRQVVGYVFLSIDIVDIPAYSGKPMVTLVGMDTAAKITGVKIIQHSEPILMVGIPESELTKFVGQYVGLNVTTRTKLGDSTDPEVKTLDAVSGATVTVIAQDLTIMKSGRIIAEQVGLIKRASRTTGRLIDDFRPMGWQELLDSGLVGHLKVSAEEVGYEYREGEETKEWINLYFAYLNLPMAGKNLMGEHNYRWVKKEIDAGGHAFLVASNGISSFKGSGFVRGGIFERFAFEQGRNSFTFRDVDYYNFYNVSAEGSPEFKEGGVYIIREGGFSPFDPFAFNFLSAHVVGSIERKFNVFKTNFMLPGKYFVIEKRAIDEDEPVWVTIWKDNIVSEILLIVILVAVVALFTQRLKLVRNRTTAEWTRYSIMLFFLIFVGFHKMAQPSVTQLLTVIHKFIGDFKWELFLLDPMIFILWWFIAITLILWGRGVFCGWICPYGTLTEFAYRIFHKVFPDRFKFEFSYKTHSKLVYIKYLIFLFLLAISFYSMALAERYAEVEPFKTAFLVGLNREWYYVTYFFVLFIACLVSYRFFCKYICPLGAGLAIPSKFSIFGIKRRDFCSSCNICTKECGSGAIDESGVIDKQECLYCLDCEENYVDSGKCPPLIKEERNKRKSETPSP